MREGGQDEGWFCGQKLQLFCTNLVPRTKGAFYSILDKIEYIQILSNFLIKSSQNKKDLNEVTAVSFSQLAAVKKHQKGSSCDVIKVLRRDDFSKTDFLVQS